MSVEHVGEILLRFLLRSMLEVTNEGLVGVVLSLCHLHRLVKLKETTSLKGDVNRNRG